MQQESYTFFRADRGYCKVVFSDILYVLACANFVKIYTKDKTLMVLITMRQMEELLLPHGFCRISRSALVGIDHIDFFDEKEVHVQKKRLQLGKVYRDQLLDSVPITLCDTRIKKPGKQFTLHPVLQEEQTRTTA